MTEEAPSSRTKRRSRGQRGKLRRFHEIDHVMVEEPFVFRQPGDRVEEKKVGEGCYVSATVHNRRFYGVLIDQAALQAASLLYFQDEASGLDLNRRMKSLKQQQGEPGVELNMDTNQRKRPPSSGIDSDNWKRPRGNIPDATTSSSLQSAVAPSPPQQVQKFRYVDSSANGGSSVPGYRLLLATYADVDAAAEDDPTRARDIEAACQSGGNFVGRYYYQYELKDSALAASKITNSDDRAGVRMSMGFQSFLRNTMLPTWFPLSNLPVAQQKVLNLLNMKKDNNGTVVWGGDTATKSERNKTLHGTQIPMKPRSSIRYRVAVVGGGIAGLSCCLELFQQCERDGIDVEVVLLEGRSRVGGRLWTDRETFKGEDGSTPFPVDLGASWIHGIEMNPLAALAKKAGVDFVTTSEEVKMLQAGMKEVDKVKDERAGELFDELLDLATDQSWGAVASNEDSARNQAAVRWYASVLGKCSEISQNGIHSASGQQRIRRPLSEPVAPHRSSSDVSVDCAIGNAIAKNKLSEFATLSDEERLMLFWNLKNVEYALGANISDLSMKFWDIDERHAFEGDHVILKQGYSVVVEHLLRTLEGYKDRFRCEVNFPVGKIEYARRTTAQTYFTARQQRLLELSDSCRVTSQDGSESILCDFVVCAVPLGVLKEAVQGNNETGKELGFVPRLPFSKRDAIESVGFGLLDKVYLQFPFAFWRNESLLGSDFTLFGNASGVNPHHYMFFDIGKALDDTDVAPAILMSLVSGNEAVDCEWLGEEDVVIETMKTLRTIFSAMAIPDPIAYRITGWGKDRFSRGSYTYLPPGTTDQDFQVLQSPINGNGDSILLDSTETMRLFFAGEHTTALHPSMAHGALLSGVRAAKEVISFMNLTSQIDDSTDRLIPVSLFRHMNPQTPVECSLCHLNETTVREGALLAFKRGSRQVLVHNNCAENSPEVEVYEGKWSNVVKACNRGKTIECFMCGQSGATIGCIDEECYRCYHFSCAENTGWRFDLDGKSFLCDVHRTGERGDCNRISMDFFSSKSTTNNVECHLCGSSSTEAGDLLAFKQHSRMAVVHEKCARYTTIVDTTEDSMSRFDHEFRNIFSAIEKAQACAKCNLAGATVGCSDSSCTRCYHFLCASALDWNFERRGWQFRCLEHRVVAEPEKRPVSKSNDVPKKGLFQHALFSLETDDPNVDVPGNLDIGGTELPMGISDAISVHSSESEEELEDVDLRKSEQYTSENIGTLVSEVETATRRTESCLVRACRPSLKDRWGIEFEAVSVLSGGQSTLLVASNESQDPFDGLNDGDVVKAINGIKVGSSELDSVRKVLSRLNQEVEVMFEVQRDLK